MNMHSFEQVRRLRRSAGIGLVTAIFLLVVLAGLAVAMVGISGAQQSASALDVQGARAYQAARAGIEWALYQKLRNPAFVCDPAADTSFALPATSTLQGFVVTVHCEKVAADPTWTATSEAAQERNVFTATACNLTPGACPNPSNNRDYVERQMMVTL